MFGLEASEISEGERGDERVEFDDDDDEEEEDEEELVVEIDVGLFD